MRLLRNWLIVVSGAVIVLSVGSVLPRLVFAGDGVGAYSGEKADFARFALVYDRDLREWPFPVDPTVAHRVTAVSGTHDQDSPCNSGEAPKGDPYHTGTFVGNYRAEVVHYGPFFVPTGKNVFDCDVATTHSFLVPTQGPDALLGVLSLAVFFGAFGLMIGTILVPAFLTIGGGVLLFGSSVSDHRKVGIFALLVGAGLAATAFLAVATTAI